MAQPWLVQWYYHGAPEEEVFAYVTDGLAHAMKLARDDSDTVTTACPAAMVEHPMTVRLKSLFSSWLWIQANKGTHVFGTISKSAEHGGAHRAKGSAKRRHLRCTGQSPDRERRARHKRQNLPHECPVPTEWPEQPEGASARLPYCKGCGALFILVERKGWHKLVPVKPPCFPLSLPKPKRPSAKAAHKDCHFGQHYTGLATKARSLARDEAQKEAR